jgi:hypothetical protein
MGTAEPVHPVLGAAVRVGVAAQGGFADQGGVGTLGGVTAREVWTPLVASAREVHSVPSPDVPVASHPPLPRRRSSRP